jgi:hypothetical protein
MQGEVLGYMGQWRITVGELCSTPLIISHPEYNTSNTFSGVCWRGAKTGARMSREYLRRHQSFRRHIFFQMPPTAVS